MPEMMQAVANEPKRFPTRLSSMPELNQLVQRYERRIAELEARVHTLTEPPEQAIRPAVVNRKVWGGNRTLRGADSQSTLRSEIVTGNNRPAIRSPLSFASSPSSPHSLPPKQVQNYFCV